MRQGIDKKALGARIRAAREKLGMSQGDLARNLGPDDLGRWASQSGVAKWEGGVRLPLYRIGDLARVLGKTEEWLRYGDDEQPSDEIAEVSAAAGVSRDDLATMVEVMRRLSPQQVKRLLQPDAPAQKRSTPPPPATSNVRSLLPPERRAKRRVR